MARPVERGDLYPPAVRGILRDYLELPGKLPGKEPGGATQVSVA